MRFLRNMLLCIANKNKNKNDWAITLYLAILYGYCPRTKLLNPLDTEGGLGEGGGTTLDPNRYVFVAFSYLLNFCRQWHLCKSLILVDLSTHLLGLVFPCPTSKKMWFGIHPPPNPQPPSPFQ